MSKSFQYIKEEFWTKAKLDIEIMIGKTLLVLSGNFVDHVDHSSSHSRVVGTSFSGTLHKYIAIHDYGKYIA